MLVLGLETSCDETAAALVVDGKQVLSNVVSSQTDHAVYGGVVPELAARRHVESLPWVVKAALAEGGATWSDIDGIGVTRGPGLVGALLAGWCYGRAAARALGAPYVGVNHLAAHVHGALMPRLESGERIDYPLLALIVSGGHTTLHRLPVEGQFRRLGDTLDDAAGEAFDKTAKLLGLGYPGGPALAKLAEAGDENAYDLPRPMISKPGFDFSFSGLKTAVMLEVRKAEAEGTLDERRADLAASFQRAAVDTLVTRSLQAASSNGMDRIVVAGGVGANRLLRSEMARRFDGEVFYPRLEFCTDNGAMIAVAGALRAAEASAANEVRAQPRWSLEALS